MQAILSDVHGNLEALSAVMADVERQGVTSIFNLGDNLGYGPNPLECLDLAMGMTKCLLGNFDHAVLFDANGFCIHAERSIIWSRFQLERVGEPSLRHKRIEFLWSLSSSYTDGYVQYVHGSARNPLNEYVFPEDIHNEQKMEKVGAKIDRICFAGHTHQPGIFRERGAGKWEFIFPEECENGFPVAGCKLICNVGAVGQPRDGDERASYALYNGSRIWIRRVHYDIEATIRKIYAEPELADFLGDRLREGQ